jgi:hypothetical protein
MQDKTGLSISNQAFFLQTGNRSSGGFSAGVNGAGDILVL